jgi:hypothetical protein
MKSATRRTVEVSNIFALPDLSRFLAITSLFEAVHHSLSSTARTVDPGIPLPLVMAGAAAVRKASRVDSLPVSGRCHSGNKVLRIWIVLREL